MKTKLAAVGFAAALSLATISGAMAAKPEQPGQSHLKEYVCHATASETNPWVLIHVSVAASGTPHVANPGHNKNGGDDYIVDDPGEGFECGGEGQG